MTTPPTDILGLIALVFLLGLKHGFDPDHLVAIDGLTRSTARARPNVSRWSGLLFSLGHGVVVTLVALIIAAAASDWQAPAWLEHLGAAISIGFLLVLGIANLLMVFRTSADRAVPPVGIKTRWFAGRLAQPSHPVLIASVGAAFALSFDTISQAILFSITGASMAGWLFPALLGVVFTLGMIVTDALNGLWVARIIRRADRRAARASRLMTLAIAALSLVLAAVGFAKYAIPLVGEHAENWTPGVSVAIILILALSYALANRLTAGPRGAKSPG